MTDVTEVQPASDDSQPGDEPEGRDVELLSVAARSAGEADLAKETDLASERANEPAAESTSGIIKGIVYW